MVCDGITCVIYLFFIKFIFAKELQGHLKPIGSHQEAEGHIAEVQGFVTAEAFYKNYVVPQRPVIFREAAKLFRAYNLWTDTYLRDHYGHIPVNVELGKKENRSASMRQMTFSEYLNMYKLKNYYMVHDLPKAMFDDLELFSPLCCGGFHKILQSTIMWLSAGGTTSVLHNDEFENINCILDGDKSFIFINENQEQNIEADGFVKERGYSLVDVDLVDMEKFPKLQNVPWWKADVKKGDCIYIPIYWYHVVRSSDSRNMAVNIWFSSLHWFDENSCTVEGCLRNLSTDMFDENNSALEKLRSEIFYPFSDLDSIEIHHAIEAWQPWQNASPQEIQQVFEVFDKNKDLALSWPEVYSIDMEHVIYDFQYILPAHYTTRNTQFQGNESEMNYEDYFHLREPEDISDDEIFRDEL